MKRSPPIVILDMDGTITLARESISEEMIECLYNLSRFVRIVIVSGSDYKYMHEQCALEFIDNDLSCITLMPCNGTKVYEVLPRMYQGKYTETFNTSMRDEIGKESFEDLMTEIKHVQTHISNVLYDLQGGDEIISDRGSTVNWSLIGRNAPPRYREDFASRIDNKIIRNEAIEYLTGLISPDLEDKLEIVLGGETSIDIYPKGWDKTYALNHFDEDCATWFIGDRCKLGQNDYHIYEHLKSIDRAFETTGPENTIEIINKLLHEQLGYNHIEMPNKALFTIVEVERQMNRPWWQKIIDNVKSKWYKVFGDSF